MSEFQRKTIIEPFKIKMVEPLPLLSRAQREKVLKEAHYNLFCVKSSEVSFDFLTDSGTSAMSAAQWAAMMEGDESYAGSKSFFNFEKTVQDISGFEVVIPTHQGRAAEHLLFSYLVKKGSRIPSNNHFNTTRANIEQLGGIAVDLVNSEGKNPASQHPFKGNIDLAALEKFCQEFSKEIPFGMITITNNTGGGQPVSLENLRAVAAIYKKHAIPFVIDCCRFAENSYFIKLREQAYQNKTVREIALECFQLADACLMSAKKDGLVNIGGFLAFKKSTFDENGLNFLRSHLILTEGFPTYGGLAGRDLEAMAIGLKEVLDENYLSYRLSVCQFMASRLNKMGIPTVQPPGGHAVYIDAKAFLSHIPAHEFPGQALVLELYLSEGIRSCEIGSVMFGKTQTINSRPHFVPASMELVRMAFPRRVYTQSHFEYILEGLEDLVKRKEQIKGVKITYEPPFLRHFTAHFEPLT